MQQNPHLTPREQQELAEIEAILKAAERKDTGDGEEWKRERKKPERYEH